MYRSVHQQHGKYIPHDHPRLFIKLLCAMTPSHYHSVPVHMYQRVDGVEVNDSGHVVAGCQCTHTTIPAECVSECMYRFVAVRVCVCVFWGGGGYLFSWLWVWVRAWSCARYTDLVGRLQQLQDQTASELGLKKGR